MSRRTFFTLGLVAFALIGFVGYETHAALQREAQLRALRQHAAQLASESSVLRRENETLAQDLAAAERQLAALPPVRTDMPAVSAERRSEMTAWLARVKQLHRLFEEHPEQRIPEMQFLTDQDWLRVARSIDFDAEDGSRRALAAIRNAATERFKPQLTSALRAFANNPPGDTTTVFALNSFANPPIDSSLLERYELSKTPETPPRWKVQTKAPVDPDYDSRYYVDVYVDKRGYGGGSTGAPIAWIPDFQGQTMRAYKAFAEANKGTAPPSLAEALPYFNPPLSPSLAEKLLKAEREMRK